jgi:hypothetical protein
MELLLNLAWLLLALPAYWLWHARNHGRARRFSPFQFLLTLGCMLVVLFPVISATDDLCAMRAEFEECPAGKHNVRQGTQEHPSASKWHAQPAAPVSSGFTDIGDYAWFSQSKPSAFPKATHSDLCSGRAPPQATLS